MSTMKLSPRTIEVIKNFSTINPSLLFRKGSVLKTKSPGNNHFGKAKIDETFPQQFAIYDLNRFLGVLSLFKEPEFKLFDKYMRIEEDHRHSQISFSSEDNIISAAAEDLKMPKGFVKFGLSKEDLENLLKAQAIMNLPEILFVGKSGNITVEAGDTKTPTSDVYSAKIGKTDKTFKVVVKAELLTKLMPENYEVEIAVNPANKSAGILHFKGSDVEYHIAPEATSTYA